MALRGTDIGPTLPHHLPVGTYALPEFRAAEERFMRSHLSAEDYGRSRAGEWVAVMRPEAQAAWRKGPSVWATFLAASSKRTQGNHPARPSNDGVAGPTHYTDDDPDL